MQNAKCIAYSKRYANLGDLLSIENFMATSVLAKKMLIYVREYYRWEFFFNWFCMNLDDVYTVVANGTF